MIPLSTLQGKKIAILGLGRSGKATAHACVAAGATPLCWDDHEAARAHAMTEGFSLTNLNTADWSHIDGLVLSPGIPHSYPAPHPLVTRACAQGLSPMSDLNCFFETHPRVPVIGVTGTNGKSTTSALITHLLKEAKQSVALGGNIGIPVLALPPLGQGFYSLELSSYQLELTPSLDLDVALLLNFSPDHLEHHGGMGGYIAAKRRIFQNRSKPLKAIIGVDDPFSVALFQELNSHVSGTLIPISAHHVLERGVCVRNGVLEDRIEGPTDQPFFTIDLRGIQTLRGIHNHQNAAASYAALRVLGFSPEIIAQGFSSFPGLAHRQEWIGTFQGITYINDSKATNAEATRTALEAYKGTTLYCILGGRPKEGGLSALQPLLSHVRHAFLIGEAAQEFGLFCTLSHVPFTLSHTLSQALTMATASALKEKKSHPVILFSPACASFDQFHHFEERGDAFRNWVLEKFHASSCA